MLNASWLEIQALGTFRATYRQVAPSSLIDDILHKPYVSFAA